MPERRDGYASVGFYLTGWPCGWQDDVPEEYRADLRYRQHDSRYRPGIDEPGVYCWLLRRLMSRVETHCAAAAVQLGAPANLVATPARYTPALAALRAGDPVSIRNGTVGHNFYGPANSAGENARSFSAWQPVADAEGEFTVFSDDRVVPGAQAGAVSYP